jgi:hypothetical protein
VADVWKVIQRQRIETKSDTKAEGSVFHEAIAQNVGKVGKTWMGESI